MVGLLLTNDFRNPKIIMVRTRTIALICYYLLFEHRSFQWIVVAASRSGSTSTAAEFGTNDGYDVGGTRPICYVTNITKDLSAPDTDGSNYTAIELLNDGMFGQQHNGNKTANSVSLLSSVRLK